MHSMLTGAMTEGHALFGLMTLKDGWVRMHAENALSDCRAHSEDHEAGQTMEIMTEKKTDVRYRLAEALKDVCYPGNPREADSEQVISMFRQLI